MADNPTPPTPAMDLLMLAIEDDEVVRKAIRLTALKALQRANEMLDVGSLATRTTVIRSIMPALVKTLERKETDDELNALREEVITLMAEVRKGVLIPQTPELPVESEVFSDDPR